MVSTGVRNLDRILGNGYPERSSILVTGPPGIGKEALGYWFVQSGLAEGDSCVYVTHRPVSDVLMNMSAFGIGRDRAPEWIASAGSEKRCDLNDLSLISTSIEEAGKNSGRTRIVTDVLSPLLVLNSPDSMYRYLSDLLSKLKQRDVVLLATVEEGMHSQSVVASMEALFDGVVELRIYELGLVLTPLLRVKKMLGVSPMHAYFRFSFTHASMEITGALTTETSGKRKELGIGGWLRGPGRDESLEAER